jgi:hypothetical protein
VVPSHLNEGQVLTKKTLGIVEACNQQDSIHPLIAKCPKWAIQDKNLENPPSLILSAKPFLAYNKSATLLPRKRLARAAERDYNAYTQFEYFADLTMDLSKASQELKRSPEAGRSFFGI